MNYLLEHEDPKVREIAEQLQAREARRERIMKLVRDALDTVRLEVKFLLFDLECTRKERDAK